MASTAKQSDSQPTNNTLNSEIWSRTTPMATSWSPHGDGMKDPSLQDTQPVFALANLTQQVLPIGPAGNSLWKKAVNTRTLPRATWSIQRLSVQNHVLTNTMISVWSNSQQCMVHGSVSHQWRCSEEPTLTAWDSCLKTLTALLRTSSSNLDPFKSWRTWLLVPTPTPPWSLITKPWIPTVWHLSSKLSPSISWVHGLESQRLALPSQLHVLSGPSELLKFTMQIRFKISIWLHFLLRSTLIYSLTLFWTTWAN